MRTEILEMLECPLCRTALRLSQGGESLVCENRHCFDFARSGGINLCGRHYNPDGGDSKECVAARREFLSLGYYRGIADAILRLLDEYAPGGRVADAGCGEGYYGDIFAAAGRPLCGFDLSKSAVDAASKRKNPNALFAVAGIFALPLADGAADAVTNIFAPCAEAEFTRVLKPGGVLIVAGAGAEHLIGLKAAIYDTPEPNTPRADLPQELSHIGTVDVRYDIALESGAAIKSLFSMTPYSYRTPRAGLERLETLNTLSTAVDVRLEIYRR